MSAARTPRKRSRISKAHLLPSPELKMTRPTTASKGRAGHDGLAQENGINMKEQKRGRPRKLISEDESMTMLFDASISLLGGESKQLETNEKKKRSPRKAMGATQALAPLSTNDAQRNLKGSATEPPLNLDELDEKELERLAWEEEAKLAPLPVGLAHKGSRQSPGRKRRVDHGSAERLFTEGALSTSSVDSKQNSTPSLSGALLKPLTKSPAKSRIPSPSKSSSSSRKRKEGDATLIPAASIIAATLQTDAERREARRRRLGLAPLAGQDQAEADASPFSAPAVHDPQGLLPLFDGPTEQPAERTTANKTGRLSTLAEEEAQESEMVESGNGEKEEERRLDSPAQVQRRRSARISAVVEKKANDTIDQPAEQFPAKQTKSQAPPRKALGGLTLPSSFSLSKPAQPKPVQRSPRKVVSTTTKSASNPAASLKKEIKLKNDVRRDKMRLAPRKPIQPAQATVPAGFRVTSSGQLVPQISSSAFSFDAMGAAASSAQKLTSRQLAMLQNDAMRKAAAAASEEQLKNRSQYKANDVPEWLKKRKRELQAKEDEQIQKRIEQVRTQELADGQRKREAASASRKAQDSQTAARKASASKTVVAKPFVSSLEARAAERAEWEARRKANEEAIEAARQKAREEKMRQEEEEYKEARRRAVPKANPVPEWLHGGKVTVQKVSTRSSGKRS